MDSVLYEYKKCECLFSSLLCLRTTNEMSRWVYNKSTTSQLFQLVLFLESEQNPPNNGPISMVNVLQSICAHEHTQIYIYKTFYFLIRIFNTNFLYYKFFLVSFASFHLLYRYFPRPFRCFLPCNVFLLQLSTFFLFQFGAKTYMCTLRNTVFVACSIHILAMVVSLSSLLSFSFSIDWMVHCAQVELLRIIFVTFASTKGEHLMKQFSFEMCKWYGSRGSST